MANTSIQCPNCRALAVDRNWTYGNAWLECQKCGYRFN